MKQASTISEIQNILKNKNNIALVPTMGNLHDGHLQLIELAKTKADFVVVSVFVNPLQFLPDEDFNTYPRTLIDDCVKLKKLGCDAVFMPSVAELYPDTNSENAQYQNFTITPPQKLAGILEGEFRSGFFDGVCTIVAKLVNIINPKIAVFGKKDYQQLLMIKKMTEALNLQVEILSCATKREIDGLAMSSRNNYLTTDERIKAAGLSKTLKNCADKIGKLSFAEIEKQAFEYLQKSGWQPDYISIRRQEDLQIPNVGDKKLVVLSAAKLGNTRLIDNLEIDL